VRDVLVRYLEERRPSLDYTSLQHLLTAWAVPDSSAATSHRPERALSV
jgi:hypothetical protein